MGGTKNGTYGPLIANGLLMVHSWPGDMIEPYVPEYSPGPLGQPLAGPGTRARLKVI